MKGLSLNAGFVAWVDNQADEDAHTLKILWQAGCIFYARTTEPQTLVSFHRSPFTVSRYLSYGKSG